MSNEEVQWLQQLFVVLMLLVQLQVGSGSLSHVDVDDVGVLLNIDVTCHSCCEIQVNTNNNSNYP
jgi:hypothetical protein